MSENSLREVLERLVRKLTALADELEAPWKRDNADLYVKRELRLLAKETASSATQEPQPREMASGGILLQKHTCECVEPYEGARLAGTPRCCERCGGLIREAGAPAASGLPEDGGETWAAYLKRRESVDSALKSLDDSIAKMEAVVLGKKAAAPRPELAPAPTDAELVRKWTEPPEGLEFLALGKSREAPPDLAALERLERIREKCEQYWNEPNIGDAEIHAALECIHRHAREALAQLKVQR